MGASTAYHLALRGQHNIILLEKEDFFGQGATGRCAGGVRYQFGTEINIRLSLLSLPMLDRFKQEIGQSIDYRKIGYLFLLTTPGEVNIFKNVVSLQNSLGAQTQWISGDDIRKMLPMMRLPDVLAGSFNPLDGLVDPNSVVMGYIGAAQRLGVKALTSSPVTGIQVTFWAGHRSAHARPNDIRARHCGCHRPLGRSHGSPGWSPGSSIAHSSSVAYDNRNKKPPP